MLHLILAFLWLQESAIDGQCDYGRMAAIRTKAKRHESSAIIESNGHNESFKTRMDRKRSALDNGNSAAISTSDGYK